MFARLVDKGFTHCTGAYNFFLRAYFPAKVRNGRINVDRIKDSRKQSADRYIVEVFFARVKTFAVLKDRAAGGVIKFLDDVWHIALAATDLNKHLRSPCVHVEEQLRASCESLRAEVLALQRQWPTNKELSSYLQCLVEAYQKRTTK